MARILPTDNILSDEDMSGRKVKKKIRNYSFQTSKRLPIDKMTSINGIKIPSVPGSCYHAIMATLAQNKDKFCAWDKIIEGTRKNMRMYGGEKSWQNFVSKSNVKSSEQRIKDNTHTLTRRGKDCYGFRLHEQGMCIYYFKDGAWLMTGGELKLDKNGEYDVIFSGGYRLQTRYRGTTMTYREYLKFLAHDFIDITGKILNAEGIKNIRSQTQNNTTLPENEEIIPSRINVGVMLSELFDQNTAERLEAIGLQVEQALDNELIGSIPRDKLEELKLDKDVVEVEV